MEFVYRYKCSAKGCTEGLPAPGRCKLHPADATRHDCFRCFEPVEPGSLYRCADCHQAFHHECIRAHFLGAGGNTSSCSEVDELKADLDRMMRLFDRERRRAQEAEAALRRPVLHAGPGPAVTVSEHLQERARTWCEENVAFVANIPRNHESLARTFSDLVTRALDAAARINEREAQRLCDEGDEYDPLIADNLKARAAEIRALKKEVK